MSNIYLISNAHLDPVWLWRWNDGFSEILATYRSALDRLKEFPDLKFTSACAAYYQWVEKLDPDMFEEIRQRVKEGRWEITGGWFLQPDCNIPDGESYVRHALISQRWFKEKFGITAKTGYNVDSFGHNASLPKILKASGMENYIFMRPSPEEQGNDDYLFMWESDDGSSVCTYRIPDRYNIDMQCLEFLDKIKEMSENKNMGFMAFIGVGNHGGGPTIDLLDTLHKNYPDMKYSATAEYFDSVEKDSLPVYKHELQHHARGCYSAEASVKKKHRMCEQNLLAAEKLCVMAKELTGTKYPAEKLTKAWKNLMFNQFHDILGGCCIKKGYDDADALFGEIMSITEQEMNYAMQKIAWNIDTLQGETLPSYRVNICPEQWTVWKHEVLGTPIVVFNPHAHAVRQAVHIYAYAKKMTDCGGNEIPFQLVRGDQTNGKDKYHTAFIAEVPPMGYAVYRFFTEKESEKIFETELTADGTTLENSEIRVTLDTTTGDICEFYDKKNKKYIIDKPCRAVLLDETECDTWAHDRSELGEFTGAFGEPEFKIIENGNVRAALQSTVRYNNSVITRTYTVIAGSNEVKVDVKADFHEKHKALKFTFPLTDETVTAKIPYGTAVRKGYTGEEPCGTWIASGGLCVANDSKYGYDTKDGEIRLTVLRGAIYADHFGRRDEFCEYMEQGIHNFSYSLFPYDNNSNADRKASELNFGLRTIMGSFHNGKLPERYSGFECNNEDIAVTAVKQAEDGNGNIIRLCEMNGNNCEVSINLFGNEIKTTVSHNELKTFTDKGKKINAIEW